MKQFLTILILSISWQFTHAQPGAPPRIKVSLDSLLTDGYGFNDYRFSAWGFSDYIDYKAVTSFKYSSQLIYFADSTLYLRIVGDEFYNYYFPERCAIIEVVFHNLKTNKELQLFIRISKGHVVGQQNRIAEHLAGSGRMLFL